LTNGCQTTSNLAPMRPAIDSRIDGGHVRRTGTSNLTPRCILAKESEEDGIKQTDADACLRELLRGGPQLATQVTKHARAQGITERALQRPRKAPRVHAKLQRQRGKAWIEVIRLREYTQPLLTGAYGLSHLQEDSDAATF